MNRVPLFLAMALSVGACKTDDTLHLEMMSSMQSATRGVVLYPDGQRGHAAMWDTTCQFDTLNGWLIEDYDLPTDIEDVQDQYRGKVLGHSPQGLHVVQNRAEDVLLDDVIHGRFLDDGTVAMVRDTRSGCVVEIDGQAATVDDAVCDPRTEITVDREGELYAATGSELLRMGKDGSENLYGDADLVVFDPATGLVYAAKTGDQHVSGLYRDGALAWRTRVPGYVHSLDRMGDRGNALVMVDDPKGGGALIVIQGDSGEIITDHSTPSGDGDVVMSDDGRTLAVVMPTDVYFYDVTADGEKPKARRTYGSPDPIFED